MKYYVRRPGQEEPIGPFTVEELNGRLKDGSLLSGWHATAAIGEKLERVKKTPERDWLPIWRISGIDVQAPATIVSGAGNISSTPTTPLSAAIARGVVACGISYNVAKGFAVTGSGGSVSLPIIVTASLVLFFCLRGGTARAVGFFAFGAMWILIAVL